MSFNLSRRALLSAGAAVALAGLPQGARAAMPMRLTIGYTTDANSQLAKGIARMAEEVDKGTNGRWRLEAYANSSLGGEAEMRDAVAAGSLPLAFITGSVYGSLFPEMGVLDIPFLFRDTAHAHAVFDGPIGQAFLERWSAKNMVGLAWGENGMRHMTSNRSPIRTPEDLKGLKIRTPPSEVILSAFKAMGADAAPLAFNELYSALRYGKFDAQENPIATFISARLDRVQKYVTLSGHIYSSAVILMSKPFYDRLSPADREVFRAAARAGGVVSRQAAAEAERVHVAAMRKAGIEVVDQIDKAPFIAKVAALQADFEQKFGKDRIKAIIETR